MRVLFIVPYPSEGQSNRFRVEQYLPYLKAENVKYCLRPFCNSFLYKVLFKKGYYLRKVLFVIFFLLKRIIDVARSMFYDVTFIHREAYPFDGCIFEWMFKKAGRRVIYDFDDSVFLKKPRKTRRAVAISDIVLAGNAFLADYARKYNNNVKVVPTCIDTDKYRPAVDGKNKQNLVIGWIGTSFTSIYLDMLRIPYRQLAEKYKNIEFRIVGGRFKDALDLPLISKEWSLKSEIDELQKFDIGVMPLFNDDMAKGKCAFKIIEYMAMGIPSVASNFGMNKEAIEDSVDGFLVEGQQEWTEKLSLLIEDENLRLAMGKNARIKAESRYSINSNKDNFLSILKEAANG